MGRSDSNIVSTTGYKWTDGSVWNYKNWNVGEPNDLSGTDDCVEYNKNPGNWNDNNCYVAKPFICKLQLGNISLSLPHVRLALFYCFFWREKSWLSIQIVMKGIGTWSSV